MVSVTDMERIPTILFESILSIFLALVACVIGVGVIVVLWLGAIAGLASVCVHWRKLFR